MDKVQVSRAVARLRRAQRIERAPDGRDGRITRLKLSRKGYAIYRRIVPLALKLEAQFLSVLSAIERTALESFLTKLALRAQALKSGKNSTGSRTTLRR